MLTKRQKQLYDAMKDYSARNGGVMPSYDELTDMVGLKSKSGVHRLVLALEERGAIRRLPGRARAIAIIPGFGVDV